jgi:hypothetical protein
MHAPLPLTSSLIESFCGLRDRLYGRPRRAVASIEIAGLAIRLEFENEFLRKNISPAFRHLETENIAVPELTILVLEESSLFERSFFLPELTAGTGENEIWLDESPEITVLLQKQGQFVAAVEWASRMACWLLPDAASIPYMARAHSLQPLLTYWLGRRERYLVHGAAVGNGKDGVLILGHNGAGKSTAALACLVDGMPFIADDHCLVSLDAEPLVHSIYGTGKVAFEEIDRFPVLAPATDTRNRPSGEKALYFLTCLPAANLVRRLRLRAILLARILNLPRTSLRAIGQAETFRALAESCALHAPAARPHALRIFKGLVQQLPGYVLELGADLRSTPRAIRQLLDRELM